MSITYALRTWCYFLPNGNGKLGPIPQTVVQTGTITSVYTNVLRLQCVICLSSTVCKRVSYRRRFFPLTDFLLQQNMHKDWNKLLLHCLPPLTSCKDYLLFQYHCIVKSPAAKTSLFPCLLAFSAKRCTPSYHLRSLFICSTDTVQPLQIQISRWTFPIFIFTGNIKV